MKLGGQRSGEDLGEVEQEKISSKHIIQKNFKEKNLCLERLRGLKEFVSILSPGQ